MELLNLMKQSSNKNKFKRKIMKKLLFTIALILATTSTMLAIETAKVGDRAPDFKLIDSKGTVHTLSEYDGKYVVLEWINFECPFVKKHYESGNMQNLQKEYTKKGVVWLTICSSAKGKQGNYSNEEIEKRKSEWNSSETAYLIDESGTVGKVYNAKTTPDMVVIDPNQNVIYMGAIDNIPSADQSDIEKADNYVVQALNSSMNGEPIKIKSSKPYGCAIKYSEK